MAVCVAKQQETSYSVKCLDMLLLAQPIMPNFLHYKEIPPIYWMTLVLLFNKLVNHNCTDQTAQAGLYLCCSQIPKTGFHARAI